MDDKVDDIQDVFMEAENSLMTTIPSNLKQLLIMNGYEDKKALSCIDDQILDNIEEFAREVLPSLITSDEYSSYYGIFKRVMMVADFYKTTFSKTSLQMVKRTSTKTRNVSCKRICTSDLSRNSSEPRMAKENETENNLILDLESERAFVETSIRKWLRNHSQFELESASYNDLNISVKVNENHLEDDDTGEKSYSCDFICYIQCVVCKVKLTCRKVKDKTHTKGRWLLSNLYRHMTIHCSENKTNSKENKSHNKKVTDYFSLNAHTNQTNNDRNNDVNVDSPNEEINLNLKSDSSVFQVSSVMTQGTHNNKLQVECPQENLNNVKKNTLHKSKWKMLLYSRREREARARHKTLVSEKINYGLEQPLITNFYPVLNKVEKLIKENANLKQMLLENINNSVNNSVEHINHFSIENMPILLKSLLKSSIANSKHKPESNVYNETMKKFSIYLFFVGGRHLYQTLCYNLPNSLPSIPSLFRYFGKIQQLSEGYLRFLELRKFLDDHNYPSYVWLSEDATRITGRIEYDSITDKLVGFVLPLKDGCPISNTYVVTSVKSILDAFENGTKSKYAYCIMAQPSVPGAPSFCISIFGTNNQFSFTDPRQQKNIVIRLNKY